MCPHILRYLATAVIINRSRRAAMKDLVKVIQQVSCNFKFKQDFVKLITFIFNNIFLFLGIIYLSRPNN